MIDETNLYRNSKKTKKILFSAVAASLLLLAVLLYSAGLFDGALKLKPAIFSAAALLLMLFLCYMTLSGIRDKSPMIHLDETGFYGRTAPLPKAFGKGEWKDVVDIQLQKSGGDTLVAVVLANTAKYEGRLSKMFWKMAHDEQRQVLHLSYSASETDLEPSALLALFVGYWENSLQHENALQKD